MVCVSQFLAVVFLFACTAIPASAATPQACEEMQARIEALSTAIEEAANEAAEATLQAELDSLSMQYASQCMMHMGGMLGTLPNLGDMLSPDKMRPAATPEQEIIRRREAINLMRRQFGDNLSVLRAGVGEREVPVQEAIPIDGRIVVEGGAVATFHRTIKQEISYTVRETYVGNLVITRYYDRIAGRYTGREDYDIQTLSTSIDVLGFDGRGCIKFTGSPSSVCTRWHRFDQWRIGDGEQYHGMYDGVVGADNDDTTVTVKVDAPDIHFSSSQGQIGTKSGCGDFFKETLSRDAFKEWIGRSETRITREVGFAKESTPGCRPGSTLTLEMRIHPEQ